MQDSNSQDVRLRGMALGQGAFYLATGLWPIFSIRTFEKVTGPKVDKWLVKAVGLLIAVTGGTLLVAGMRRKVPTPEIPMVAAGQALALGGVSLFYGSIGRISRIYLLDALTEGMIAAGWGWALKSRMAESSQAAELAA